LCGAQKRRVPPARVETRSFRSGVGRDRKMWWPARMAWARSPAGLEVLSISSWINARFTVLPNPGLGIDSTNVALVLFLFCSMIASPKS
jgi:hypothetical protein